jgi:hypothetical protein
MNIPSDGTNVVSSAPNQSVVLLLFLLIKVDNPIDIPTFSMRLIPFTLGAGQLTHLFSNQFFTHHHLLFPFFSIVFNPLNHVNPI